jgi:hypothetical protein
MKKPYYSLIPSGYRYYTIYSILPTDGSKDLYFYRQSGSSRVAEDGLIESTYGVPTMDWLNSDCPVLKCEAASTNYQLYSEDFTAFTWAKSYTTVIGNDAISPKGTEEADKLIPNTTNIFHHAQAVTGSGGNAYNIQTYSLFVKKAGYSQVQLIFADNTAPYTPYAQVKFDLDTLQTLGTTIGNFDYQDYGNGWYRLAISGVPGNYTSNILRVAVLENGSETFLGNGIDGLYIWGAQYEPTQPTATSYIPTSSGISTRTTDLISPEYLDLNPIRGAMFLDIKPKYGRDVSYLQLTGGYADRISFRFNTNNTVEISIGNAPAPPFFLYTYSHNNDRFKVAINWDEGNVKLFINGVKVRDENPNQSNNSLEFLKFELSNNANFNGDIHQVSIYKESLNDAELTKLTEL